MTNLGYFLRSKPALAVKKSLVLEPLFNFGCGSFLALFWSKSAFILAMALLRVCFYFAFILEILIAF